VHAPVLRYVREVARAGSIRRAAVALNVASSAINRQILKLEAELGVQLFDRLPDGMRPTAAGEVLLRHVRDTLGDWRRLLAEIDAVQGVTSGHIRIAAIDSALVEFLPTALDAFLKHYPAVTFSVSAGAPGTIPSLVEAAEADIGLGFSAPVGPALHLAASVPMPIGAVLPCDHPLAARKQLSLREVAKHRLLMQETGLPAMPMVDDEFIAFRHNAEARVTSNTIGFIKRMLLAGAGVGCYTRLGFLAEIASGELVWRPLDMPGLASFRLGLYTAAHRSLTPAARALVADLVARMEAL
jgi:DNA-binding transcriptional LysR family regulator